MHFIEKKKDELLNNKMRGDTLYPRRLLGYPPIQAATNVCRFSIAFCPPGPTAEMKNMFNWGDISYEWYHHLSTCRCECMCVLLKRRCSETKPQGWNRDGRERKNNRRGTY